jgi:hypothetical protein
MKRLSWLPLALGLLAWAPDAFQKRDAVEVQALTRAAPTLSTEGIDGMRMIAFTVVLVPVTVPGTTTFSGGGTIDLYFRDTTAGWYLADPLAYSWSLAGCAGKTSCSKTFEMLQPRGRILPAANGVTVSAGTQVTVRILGTLSGQSSSI